MTDIDTIIDYMAHKAKQSPALRDWFIDALIMDDTRTRLLLNLLRDSNVKQRISNYIEVAEIIREQLDIAYGTAAEAWAKEQSRRTELGVYEDQARGI